MFIRKSKRIIKPTIFRIKVPKERTDGLLRIAMPVPMNLIEDYSIWSKNNKNLKGYTELRYDQVRIILKHVKDNIYNVQGVFVKKDDNDIHMYTTMANRMIPDISTERLLSYQLELAEKTEEELKKLVQEKGRKGTR